jgi:L-amino acid N-acyltransferase YncA
MIGVRAATPEDAGAIAAIYAPHVLAGTVSFETEAPDARAMRTRMASS